MVSSARTSTIRCRPDWPRARGQGRPPRPARPNGPAWPTVAPPGGRRPRGSAPSGRAEPQPSERAAGELARPRRRARRAAWARFVPRRAAGAFARTSTPSPAHAPRGRRRATSGRGSGSSPPLLSACPPGSLLFCGAAGLGGFPHFLASALPPFLFVNLRELPNQTVSRVPVGVSVEGAKTLADVVTRAAAYTSVATPVRTRVSLAVSIATATTVSRAKSVFVF